MKTNVPSAFRLLVPALLALAAAPQRADAQEPPGLPVSTAGGARLERYDFAEAEAVGIERVSLLTIPFGAETRVAGRVRLSIAGTFATATLRRPDGSESTLSGPTDTDVRVTLPLIHEWLTVTGVAVLPTGRQRLSADELEVASLVASDLLPFAISHWGSGGGVGGSVAVARRFGTVGVGMSGGYRASREYRALDDDGPAYRPGDERFVRMAVDRSFGSAKATLQVGINRYARDQLGRASLYRSGDRYQVIGSYALAGPGRTSGVVYTGVLHRRHGSQLSGPAERLPSQNLVLAGAGARIPLGAGALLPSADARIFRSSDGVGQGYGVGLGASAEWPVGRMTLVPSARLRMGRVVVADDAESPLDGLELGLTLRRGGR
jgi:hypothetical protein